MKLSEARQLQKEIHEEGLHCTVPLGYGPDGYFVRIYAGREVVSNIDLASPADWEDYKEQRRPADPARVAVIAEIENL